MKIPQSFKLFGSTVNVVIDNDRMHDLDAFGVHEYSKHLITLSTVDRGDQMSDDRVMDCFYHEKVHAILEAMKETELNRNEKFVDIFAKLLRQSDETAEY